MAKQHGAARRPRIEALSAEGGGAYHLTTAANGEPIVHSEVYPGGIRDAERGIDALVRAVIDSEQGQAELARRAARSVQRGIRDLHALRSAALPVTSPGGWRVVTESEDEPWPCTIIDADCRGLLAVHNGTPIIRSRALADKIVDWLNGATGPGEGARDLDPSALADGGVTTGDDDDA